ncbi:ammonium transporter [Candidatus Sumerlaeota bacterium]|nr:ammonium transporter [Candidatus Sumerlaeota bacterium]
MISNHLRKLVLLVCGIIFVAGSALAQAPQAAPDLAAQVMALQQKVADAQMAGDNAWVLTSAAFVLMMTAPGLMLFYGGLVRSKNVLSIFVQCFYLMALVSILWLLFGYSLAFSKGNAFIGGFEYAMLHGVGGAPNTTYAPTLPHQTWMVFQLMFAIITPGLMIGSFAERFRFRALAVFMLLWVTIVYFPLAHMVWGEGGFLNAFIGPENGVKALDFAGGTVVHISSGVSALVCAIYLGKRTGYPGPQFLPHNLVLSAIGAGLLWMGWFGFNAGSALNSGALASAAFVSTHMSAAGATMAWLLAEWIFRGKPSLLGGISGAVAGLVAVTPAAGFVTPTSGLLIGLIAGVFCWFACTKIKSTFKYDDSLDVFGVHGLGGMLGAILTGVFATKNVNGALGDTLGGLVDGNPHQILNQLIAVGITIALSVVATGTLIFVVDKALGAKAAPEEQEVGMDIADSGESAYHPA